MIPFTLLDRVRASLQDRSPREVRMFGGISFMIEQRLVVAVRKDGTLLVHVDPQRGEELLAEPGTRVAKMGNKPMGAGWLAVEESAVESDLALEKWLSYALECHDVHSA